jgi:hypothetical protein
MLLAALFACAHARRDSLLVDAPEANPASAQVTPAEILAEAAGSSDPSVRARALAAAIAADPAPAGGTWGGRGAFDPDGWVAGSAVAALAPRVETEPETRALLREMVAWNGGDPYARAQAGWLLRADPESAEVLRATWHHATTPWDVAPLALPAASIDPEAARALNRAVASGELGLEPRFYELLGDVQLPGLADAARAGAERVDDLAAVSWAAMRLDLGDGAAESLLREDLAGPDEMGALGVLDALVTVDGDQADGLIRRAKATGGDLVRWYAEILLAARTGDDADVLLRAMSEPDREVREIAARHLRDLADVLPPRKLARLAGPVIRAGLVDRDASVRAEAARSAGALGMKDPGLVALLADPSERVRVEAAAALTPARD